MNRKRIEKIISLTIITSIISTVNISAAEVTKDESVYANLDSKGKLDTIIVSDWLHSTDGNTTFNDMSELDDIKNIKGEDEPDINGNILTWNTNSSDVYYQGTSKEELPLDVEVKYYLDDKEINPEDLRGESGKVKIELRLKNKKSKQVRINEKDRTIYVPFTTAAAITLSNDKFSNVKTDEGKLLSEGNNVIVAFVAFPGLKESLNLDSMNLDVKLEDKITIEADVKDFSLAPIMITATPQLPDLSDFDKIQGRDQISDALNQLKEGSDKLLDATGKLKDGMELAQTKLIDADKFINVKDLKNKASFLTSSENLYLSNKLIDDAFYVKDMDASKINNLISIVSPSNIEKAEKIMGNANTLKNKYEPLFNSSINSVSQLSNDENFKKLIADIKNVKAGFDGFNKDTKDSLEILMNILTEENLKAAEGLLSNTSAINDNYNEVQKALGSAIQSSGGMSNFLNNMSKAVQMIQAIDNVNTKALESNMNDFISAYSIFKSELAVAAAQGKLSDKKQELKQDVDLMQSKGLIDGSKVQRLKQFIDNARADAGAFSEDNKKINETINSLNSLKKVLDELNKMKSVIGNSSSAIESEKLAQLLDKIGKLSNEISSKKELITKMVKALSNIDINNIKTLVLNLRNLVIDIQNNTDEIEKINKLVSSLSSVKELRTDLAKFKGDLDEINSLVNDIQKVTGDLKSGELDEINKLLSMQKDLKDSEDILRITKDALNDGNIAKAKSLINSLPSLKEGINTLASGSRQLNEGMKKYHDNGIDVLYDKGSIMINTLDDVIQLKDELVKASKNYDSFSGKSEEMEGKVKFIIKTAEIEEKEKEEDKDIQTEKKGFFQWLKSLIFDED